MMMHVGVQDRQIERGAMTPVHSELFITLGSCDLGDNIQYVFLYFQPNKMTHHVAVLGYHYTHTKARHDSSSGYLIN